MTLVLGAGLPVGCGGGFTPQEAVTATIPVAAAPTSVTLASPDLAGDQSATFTYAGGNVTVSVGTLLSSVAVVVR